MRFSICSAVRRFLAGAGVVEPWALELAESVAGEPLSETSAGLGGVTVVSSSAATLPSALRVQCNHTSVTRAGRESA